MSFPDLLQQDAARVQARLQAALTAQEDVPVVQAMRYALQGGKRLRAFLVLESARLHGIAPMRRWLPLRRWKPFMPIAWCMTICPAWMTMICAVACPPSM